MARRLILAVAFAATAFAYPAGSLAATAPTSPPVLATAPYALPATFTWTPAANGTNPLDPNTSQQVRRADGACPQGPVADSRSIGPARGMAATSHTTSDGLADGTYCFFIRTTSLLGGSADGPGLTLSIDTQNPTGTVTVAPTAPGRIVTGTVSVTGTSADGVSGVSSSTFHVGAPNACASGAVIGPAWDTTTSPNGTYQVCNVIIDNAGHQAVVATRVTVANPVSLPGQPAAAAAGGGAAAVAPPALVKVISDPAAPRPPTKVRFSLPRTKAVTGTVSVRLRWVKPKASDLARIVVVLNREHPPRTPADGTIVYKGLGTSTSLRFTIGDTGYVALYAYSRGGNYSLPARKVVSLAPLIPLRPRTGSSIRTAPRLTWKAQGATAYYNVQVFRNGSRVLTAWPSKPAFSIPRGKLRPGTYVWFVWPAVRHPGKPATFGRLIGRATFVFKTR